jgi:endonuclease/exonuclease/phosphatase family metal-dependent hydrolase
MKLLAILTLAVSLFAVSGRAQKRSTPFSAGNSTGPDLLQFDELVALSSTAKPTGQLGAKLQGLLTTPFVSNDIKSSDARPVRPIVDGSGPVLRVGLWNIERGLNYGLIESALTNTNDFERTANGLARLSAAKRTALESQLSTLQGADVLVLNEVDLGMKRTDYRDVARDLAEALHMNYAYGVEFVEVDPLFELGTEKVHLASPQQDVRLQADLSVDKDLYRGLHGTAILSRYPIVSARIFRLPPCYDWYGQESKKIAQLERGKRWAARTVFGERVEREVRQGGRMALIADLAVPELPSGKATVVATHLENRCPPSCRRRQMKALLAELKADPNVVVLAGDLNTTSKDNTPTSIRHEILSRVTDYQFWIGQAVSQFNPLGMYKYALVPAHYFHGYGDPTAFHVPILWENRERSLFRTVENFRFSDGRAFDFRGDEDRTQPARNRTLANSNERGWKGFVPTYSFSRDYAGLAGRFKLDWIFVKPLIRAPRREGQCYRFAPQFAKTLRALNESVAGRISDHAPLTVDLTLDGTNDATPC